MGVGRYGAGKRSSRGGSGNMANQIQHANLFMGSALYSIANKLPPNERVTQKPKEAQKIHQAHLSDETAVEMILRHRATGETPSELAKVYGFSQSGIRRILNGENRPHLLRMVEECYAEHRISRR